MQPARSLHFPAPRVHVVVNVGTPFARVLLGRRATLVWSHALTHGDGADPGRLPIIVTFDCRTEVVS